MCRHDKFAAARELMVLFNAELARHLQCGEFIVQDETLYPYRGARFPFRIYIKGKQSAMPNVLYLSLFSGQG